ncbi:thiamine diphosphokinase [Nioella aestuarii]|uniref:thiamine diphosphokinase n=1 Tax=Nioella aestuarii TaxID=1662864 RepID=UPI003D7F9603
MTILGGGDVNPDDLADSLRKAPALVAADGGADRALDLGFTPDLVVGDLDSLSATARASIPADRLIRVAEQESTDFEKALSRIEAPGVLALGMTGRRTDHELAAWHVLMRCRWPRCIVVAEEDIVFLCPPVLRLFLPVGTRLSLFPMAKVSGISRGLHWPIDGIAFAPGRTIGTSNRVATEEVRIELDHPAMLVILPKEHLPAAVSALF